MKEARKLLNAAGLPLWRLVISYFIIKDLVMIPLMSRIWGLCLKATPDGYISNANLGQTLLKCPWIVLVGAMLLGSLLFFVWWQVYATVLGVAYVHEGKNASVRELLYISWTNIIHGFGVKNWPMIIYVIVILPLTNLYHATNMVGSFAVPEYIQDFIDSKLYLSIINFFIVLVALFFALRWFYMLPSFCLKGKDFKTASKESFYLTKKKAVRSGAKLTLYGVIETIRLSVVPYLVVIAMAAIIYYLVRDEQYATEVFRKTVGRGTASMVGSVSGVLVYLSSICYVVNDYYKRCKEENSEGEIQLPELKMQLKKHMSGRTLLIVLTAVMGIGMSLFYFTFLMGIKYELFSMEDYFGQEKIVAHKGYSSKAPENTMDSFELADKADSVDLIELDVWSSKDGIPVVIHNETIAAATGLSGNIYDYTYEELQNISAPYSFDSETYKDARIPSLEEVISSYAASTPLLIEIKGYKKDEQLPAKIVALMEKYNCTETSMIHSGDYGALKAVKECNPDIKCGLIQAVVSGNSYDLPYADFLSVEHTFVNLNMIDQLHIRGKEIFVWTVNNSESVDDLSNMPIDAYITDYPDSIAFKLDEEESDVIESIIYQLPFVEYADDEKPEIKMENNDY